ncbi:MAG: PLP-dependent aminotransferase family protein [Alphaproteobacteria bacterium]|nr:PLP-dependent aminotransferase family protein [Alphaproteobacteria bacterium]
MTKFPTDNRPKYVAIAEGLAADIRAGRLPPGGRLPTQRALADEVGVTVGTVTRAYALLRQQGLIVGEVGRGTFVRPVHRGGASSDIPSPTDHVALDLSVNTPTLTPLHGSLRAALEALPAAASLDALLQYPGEATMTGHRRLLARWIQHAAGLETSAEQVVLTLGAQHAMLVALSTLAEPGQRIACPELVFPGLKALARYLRLRLHPVALDEQGLSIDSLEEAVRAGARVLYCTPTLQNPTGLTWTARRRAEVVALARERDLTVIEDDTYGFLCDPPPRALCADLPEQGVHLSSLSKVLAPGLRVGAIRAPARAVEALRATVMTTTLTPSTVTLNLAAGLLAPGPLARTLALRRAEQAERSALARAALGPWIPSNADPRSPHLWLPLPEPWRAAELCAHAAERGVRVASPEPFTVGQRAAPQAVRISLCAAPTVQALADALDLLRGLLRNPPGPSRLRI